VFDSNGAKFELSPLTILTGCNSSGKSSLTKLWMLVQDFFQQISSDIIKGDFKAFEDYCINFTRGNHKLGSFESVVNWQSNSNEIVVEYDVDVYSIGRSMNVSIVFAPSQTMSQKRNPNDILGSVTSSKKSPSKSNQSLFAKVSHLEISDPQLGVFFEYDSTRNTSIFHVSRDYRNLLASMSLSLDYKGTIDEIITCREASECGFYFSSELDECDIDSLIKVYGENEINQIHTRWELFKQKLPTQYASLIKKHGLTNIIRDKNHEIDWEQTKNSHKFEDYSFFYPMKFIKELDSLEKHEILKWVEDNIIDKSKGEWFDCEKFRARVYYIFNKYIDSVFSKFSEFWSYYELAAFKDYAVNFGTHNNLARFGFFFGTACEAQPWNHNQYEEDWNWENVPDATFFHEMFSCLSGFGGYSDISMMGGPEMELPELDVMMKCAEYACLEALVSVSDICNAQFVEIDRSNTQRIYTFGDQGTSFNRTLESYLETPETIRIQKGKSYSFYPYKRGAFLNKWLKNLTDLEEACFELAPEGVGIYVYLKKKFNGKTHRLSLADVGYGTTPLVSMLVRIELMICEYLQKEDTKGVLFIEEPESNLHPNLQATLAEMFADAITNYPIKFVLETHSEYLIRKLQTIVATKNVSADDISIYYMANPDAKKRAINEPQIKQIKIKETGGLTAKFGTGFFDESTILSTELFRR
jgi:hypothetical protein